MSAVLHKTGGRQALHSWPAPALGAVTDGPILGGMDLCRVGHVASARRLRDGGVTRRAVAAAVSSGRVVRATRGVYACAHLDPPSLTALGAGGLIDCVSALDRNGVWVGDVTGLHLRARPHHHLRPTTATFHWSEQLGSGHLEVSPIDALLQAMSCLDPYNALAAVESALHLGYFSDLALLRRESPGRMNRVLERLDRGAESGLETIVRLRLVDAGFRVRTQVRVGRWPVDVLVAEKVAVEVDGRKWHQDRFIKDRTRDIDTEAAGIRVLRIAKTHVVDSWPRTLEAITRMVIDA